MESLSNREVVILMKKGSLEALGILYDRFNQMVYRTAVAITGNREAAEDLLQDVFLRLHRFADRIDVERPIEPWICRMTANLSYTRVKRQKWTRPIEDVAEWLAGSNQNNPDTSAERGEEKDQIQEIIQTLPLPQRMVIVMYYINELSLEEIAEALKVPKGTVKSRLHYGRQALKKCMSTQDSLLSEVGYEFT